MTIIVNTGSTLTVTQGSGLALGSASTVAAGGLLDGSGAITGGFALLNLGTIEASVTGAVLSIAGGTLTNQGTIAAANGTLIVQASETDTNLSGTTLTGGVWSASGNGTVELTTGQIVTDNATITLNGTGSAFDGFNGGSAQAIDNSLVTIGSTGVLNLQNGRNFTAASSLVVNGTLTLGGGTLSASAGTITIGANGDIVGFGSIDPGVSVIDGGTIEAKGGTFSLPQSGLVLNTGILKVDAGASLDLQTAFSAPYTQGIINNGTIDAVAGFLSGTVSFSGSYSGTGGFLIEGGGAGDTTILELQSSMSGNVSFDTNHGQLLLDQASSFNGTVSGFGTNQALVLGGVNGAVSATLNGQDLNLRNGSNAIVDTVTLNTNSLNYDSANFSVSDIGGSATVTATGVLPCFAAGTRIRTLDGEVPVERLAAGDVIHSHFAGSTPVVWIGHRQVNCRRHPEPSKVWPVLVSAHAFGPRMPHRDLMLSPDHAVFVDGVLIPIKYLINGKTITQIKVDQITYYHVELGEHDVLLAEGMPAESYLETGDRRAFDNAGGPVALHPDFGIRRWEAFACAPLVVAGAALAGVAARTRARIPKQRRPARPVRQVA